MSKRILIDASNAEETRVAVIANGKLDDYEVERGKKNAVKGDVYLAKITRVEPSLQAAFVEFGASRNGFLPLTEIHPDYFKIPIADQDKLSDLLKILQDDENKDTDDTIIKLFVEYTFSQIIKDIQNYQKKWNHLTKTIKKKVKTDK